MQHDQGPMYNILFFWYDTLMRYFCTALLVFVISVPVTGGIARAQTVEQHEAAHLEGRWKRTDGEYVLELNSIRAGGALTAAYFNPQPINVSKAAWHIENGEIYLFVELRDINYPGSAYLLQYDPASDLLLGNYFQAVAQLTYAIKFSRIKQ